MRIATTSLGPIAGGVIVGLFGPMGLMALISGGYGKRYPEKQPSAAREYTLPLGHLRQTSLDTHFG